MNKLHVVISRFAADTSWVNKLPVGVSFDIFNKGNDLDSMIKLPNIGRESHTYLYYIIKNYDKLPENICFLQDNPFDHSPNVLNNINKFLDSGSDKNFTYLSENIIKCDMDGRPHHSGLKIGEFLNKIGLVVSNDIVEFGAGAQFIVDKKSILKHDISFYEKTISYLNNINPSEAYVLERIWGIIFNY